MINNPANLHSVKQRAAALSTSPTCTPLPVKGRGEKEVAPISSQEWGLLLMGSQADAPPAIKTLTPTCLRPIPALER